MAHKAGHAHSMQEEGRITFMPLFEGFLQWFLEILACFQLASNLL
jgi:hypothetical protein